MHDVVRGEAGMACRRFGPEEPTGSAAFVLLHGIPGCGAAWHAVATQLATHHAVIVPDLLGFGASHRPTALHDLHARAQARALASLLDELRVDRVIVAGHDFGGPIGLTLHADRPQLVAGMALLATNAFTDTPIPPPLNLVTWRRGGPALARVMFSAPSLAMMLRFGVGRPRTKLDLASHIGDRRQRQAIRTIFHGSLVHLRELYRPIEDTLHSLSIPVTVGWGDRDPIFGVDQGERTATAAGATLTVYEGAGHFLPEERPGAVASDLAALASSL